MSLGPVAYQGLSPPGDMSPLKQIAASISSIIKAIVRDGSYKFEYLRYILLRCIYYPNPSGRKCLLYWVCLRAYLQNYNCVYIFSYLHQLFVHVTYGHGSVFRWQLCNNVVLLWNTHTRLTAPFPGLPRWTSTRKVKPIWILLKQETVSGCGISWAICKSAPRSRQITTPAPHHSCQRLIQTTSLQWTVGLYRLVGLTLAQVNTW